MKRHLSLLLCALVGAVALSVPSLALHAKPAFASNNCNPSQSDDQVFERTDLYRSKRFWVWDSWDPTVPGHWVDTDIKTYQVSHANQCWRSYYTSAWTEDGTPMNVIAWMRIWVCGQGPWQFNSGDLVWTNNRRATPQGPWGPNLWINYNVQMYDGTWVGMSFAPYGDYWSSNLCGPQEDQYGSRAGSPTWYNPQWIYSDPSNPYWYVNGW